MALRRLAVVVVAAALLAAPASAPAMPRAKQGDGCKPATKRAKRCGVRATIRVRRTAPALLGSRGLEPARHFAPLALWF